MTLQRYSPCSTFASISQVQDSHYSLCVFPASLSIRCSPGIPQDPDPSCLSQPAKLHLSSSTPRVTSYVSCILKDSSSTLYSLSLTLLCFPVIRSCIQCLNKPLLSFTLCPRSYSGVTEDRTTHNAGSHGFRNLRFTHRSLSEYPCARSRHPATNTTRNAKGIQSYSSELSTCLSKSHGQTC